jgi:hypothetical protein
MPLTQTAQPEVRQPHLLIRKMRFRARQAAGKVRRFVFANIHTSRNNEMLALRQGECTRCGACCKILFRCPFLIEEPGQIYSCGIYGAHFNSCRIFPLVPKDLEEVEEPCGYTFAEPTRETRRSE